MGAIVALSPALDEATKAEFNAWGPGKYDPRHHAFNGTSLLSLNSPSMPVVLPPIYGLKGVGFETFTGDGPISYWNSYVGVGQMGGQGTFSDPRIGLFITQTPDLVTPKLPALLEYQLSLRTPAPPKGSFDRAAARRGERLFRNEARMRRLPPGAALHRRAERPRVGGALPARSGRGRHGPDLRRPERHAEVPDDAAAGLWQHPPVLPRRQRARSPGGGRPLRRLFS